MGSFEEETLPFELSRDLDIGESSLFVESSAASEPFRVDSFGPSVEVGEDESSDAHDRAGRDSDERDPFVSAQREGDHAARIADLADGSSGPVLLDSNDGWGAKAVREARLHLEERSGLLRKVAKLIFGSDGGVYLVPYARSGESSTADEVSARLPA